MPKEKGIFRRLIRYLYRENLHRAMLVIFGLSVASSLALWQLEPGNPLADWLWWSVVTITTVGYGDLAPTTAAGRGIGIILMFSGIGVLGMFTATVASFFVDLQLRRDLGMNTFPVENHFIICEWNSRAESIYQELRADPRTEDSPIVLLTDAVERKPVDDDRLYFIHGDMSEENLRRAGVDKAETVVVLGDDRLEPGSRDAKVVLTTLSVEGMNRGAYTVVELVREENARHCERANADEIVIGEEFGSRLIASAVVDHGITKVVSELLSTRFGHDLQKMPIPEGKGGSTFLDVMTELKRSNTCTVLSVIRGDEVIANPPAEFELRADDHLVVIAERKDRDS